MSAKPLPQSRSGYRQFISIATRWMDNDVYGHVNNVNYYSFFDTAVNRHLIDQGVLDIQKSDLIGLVVETHCNYFAPIAFPQTIEVGLRVAKVGSSSVRYEIALFAQDSDQAVAQGHFVHVYVNRADNRPVAVAGALRDVVEALRVSDL